MATNKGKIVADNLASIGKKNGYNFLIYATENKLHGNPQKRPRSFYFFFRNDLWDGKVPLLDNLSPKSKAIEELLDDVELKADDPMNLSLNDSNPADNLFYQYLMEFYKATSHRDLVMKLSPTTSNQSNSPSLIGRVILMAKTNGKMDDLAQWMKDHRIGKVV